MRVHQQDSGGTDRSTQLNNIVAGSTIEMVTTGYEWEVLSASKTGSVYTFTVNPSSREKEDTSNFKFTYTTAATVNYVYQTNFYSPTAQILGIYSTTGLTGITTNSNAYGVDIKIQQATISDDFDFLAYTQR